MSIEPLEIPLPVQWNGENFTPAKRFADRCSQELVVGHWYSIIEQHERSMASHRHYFACINECWKNLPEAEMEEYPDAEALRKKALIKAGFYNVQDVVCASHAEALRWSAVLKPIERYSIVIVKGLVVRRYTAQSQSLRAMGKKDFQASKQAVLEVIAAKIGVPVETLQANAGMAA